MQVSVAWLSIGIDEQAMRLAKARAARNSVILQLQTPPASPDAAPCGSGPNPGLEPQRESIMGAATPRTIHGPPAEEPKESTPASKFYLEVREVRGRVVYDFIRVSRAQGLVYSKHWVLQPKNLCLLSKAKQCTWGHIEAQSKQKVRHAAMRASL